MMMTRKSRSALLLLLLAPLLLSCEAFWAPLEELTDHGNPVVSVPATVGSALGGVVGVPVAVAALPITVPIAVATAEGSDANLLPLAPMFAVAQIGAIVVAGPFWLLFGWWT